MVKNSCIIALLIFTVLSVLAMTIMLIAASVKRLDANETAIMYDTVKKEFVDVKGPGLYNGPPFFSWIIFTAVFKQVDLALTCVTRDGLPVNLQVSFQYVPLPEALKEIALKYRDQDKYDTIVSYSSQAAIQVACTSFDISDYQNSRPIIQTKIEEQIVKNLKYLKADAIAAQLVNVEVPNDWNLAVSDKQKQQQDIVLASNERNQSLYQAQLNMSLAIQDALITNQTAMANITAIQNIAEQNSTAVIQQYSTLEQIFISMMVNYKLDFVGLVGFLKNQVVRLTPSTDIVMAS
jgi:prohibitin 2